MSVSKRDTRRIDRVVVPREPPTQEDEWTDAQHRELWAKAAEFFEKSFTRQRPTVH